MMDRRAPALAAARAGRAMRRNDARARSHPAYWAFVDAPVVGYRAGAVPAHALPRPRRRRWLIRRRWMRFSTGRASPPSSSPRRCSCWRSPRILVGAYDCCSSSSPAGAPSGRRLRSHWSRPARSPLRCCSHSLPDRKLCTDDATNRSRPCRRGCERAVYPRAQDAAAGCQARLRRAGRARDRHARRSRFSASWYATSPSPSRRTTCCARTRAFQSTTSPSAALSSSTASRSRLRSGSGCERATRELSVALVGRASVDAPQRAHVVRRRHSGHPRRFLATRSTVCGSR